MSQERFLIRLRISSSKFQLAILFTISFLFFGCGETVVRKPPPPIVVAPVVTKPVVRQESPRAPWEVWTREDFGDSLLRSAEEQVRVANFDTAIRLYRQAEEFSPSATVKTEAFLRRMGTLLKLGRSDEVLTTITARLKGLGVPIESTPPELALLVAYAYDHQRNRDQALAWFGVAERRSQGIVRERARLEKEAVIANIPEADFEAEQLKWAGDIVIAAVFAAERTRRINGGKPEPRRDQNWFSPRAYGSRVSEGQLVESDLIGYSGGDLPQPGAFGIGVLLPLSGQYGQFGQRVKQGLELALEEAGVNNISFSFRDTQGSPEQAVMEYQTLVQNDRVSLVLGPLLAETSERVARESEREGVPIISLSKRKGLPEIGPNVFRFGATAENQVREIIAYAVGVLQVNSLAIVYPETGQGAEFREVFSREIRKQGRELAGEFGYSELNEENTDSLLQALSQNGPQAIFFADELENLWPLLQRLPQSSLRSAKLLGTALWDDPVAVRGVSSLLDGAAYVSPFFVQSTRPEISTFVEKFRDKFGKSPDLLAAQGYDLGRIALELFQEPTPQGRNLLIKKIEMVDNRLGITGKLDINNAGDIQRRMSIIRLVKGELVEVMAGGEVTGFSLDEKEPEEFSPR